MKKRELARKLAEQTRQTESAAADELDDAIHSVIKGLKNTRRQQTRPNALERLIEEAECAPDVKGDCAKS